MPLDRETRVVDPRRHGEDHGGVEGRDRQRRAAGQASGEQAAAQERRREADADQRHARLQAPHDQLQAAARDEEGGKEKQRALGPVDEIQWCPGPRLGPS